MPRQVIGTAVGPGSSALEGRRFQPARGMSACGGGLSTRGRPAEAPCWHPHWEAREEGSTTLFSSQPDVARPA